MSKMRSTKTELRKWFCRRRRRRHGWVAVPMSGVYDCLCAFVFMCTLQYAESDTAQIGIKTDEQE